MNWEAVAAVGEIVCAMVAALTVGYFAIQLRAAKDAAADINRLERAKGVREMMLATSLNNELRETVTKGLKLESYYEELGKICRCLLKRHRLLIRQCFIGSGSTGFSLPQKHETLT